MVVVGVVAAAAALVGKDCALQRMVAMEAVMEVDFSGTRVGAMGVDGEC